MKKQKNQPTWRQMVLSLAIAVLFGGMVYNGLEALINELIKSTLHTPWAPYVPIISALAVCSLIPAVIWIAYKLSYKMANLNDQNEKASDI